MLSVLDAPLSEPAVKSGVDGAFGAVLSIVTDKADDARLTFPAASVAFTVMLAPCARVELIIVQLPELSAVALPIWVVPSNSLIRLFASAVPVKVGVASLVILSVLEAPLSEAAIRSGADGALGAVVSIVIDKADDATLTLPAASVAFAVMLCTPFARVELVIDQLPEPSAVAVPIRVVPSNSVTVLFASAVPLNVGAVTLVILSVLELPLSDAAIRSDADGALGAIVSTTRDWLASVVDGALASARRIV